MKSILGLFLFFAISLQSFGQEEFTYSQTGLSPEYIIIERDSATKMFLYENCIRWIEDTFLNPDKMIIMNREGEKIRIQGFWKEFTDYEYQGDFQKYDARYTIEIAFKDGRLKFEPLKFEALAMGQEVPMIGLRSTTNEFYKENGEVHEMYAKVPGDIEKIFNHFLNDLRNYEFEDLMKKDDW